MKQAAKIFLCFIFIYNFSGTSVEAQRISLEFREQGVSDILFAIAQISGVSIMVDESVSGTASFVFNDDDFLSAVSRFCTHTGLFFKIEGGTYLFSKIHIQGTGDGNFTVDAEEVSPSLFVRKFSRESGITVMNDPFPDIKATVRLKSETPENILSLLVSRYDGYELFAENGGFFIRRTSGARRQEGRQTVRLKDGLMEVIAPRTQLSVLLPLIFERGGFEYVMLSKNNPVLEGIRYSGKEFDDLLRLVLGQSGCDFVVKDGIYYIFDIQQKSAAKSLKDTRIVRLRNIRAADLMAMFPPEMGAGELVKIDKSTNSLIITGSNSEADPLIEFIERMDEPHPDLKYESFTVSSMSAEQAVSMLPAGYTASEAMIIPGTSTFVVLADSAQSEKIKEFLLSVDKRDPERAVNLKYISSDELKENLPASVDKERVRSTGGTNTVFFSGNEEQYENFIRALSVIDRPKDQIRYHLLVIQYQKSGGRKLGTEFSMSNSQNGLSSSSTGSNGTIISANLSNLMNIGFDVVSLFGLQMAIKLNAELSDSTAKIMADTTLNGISGKDITFENKNIFRYRDIITDTDNRTTYTSIVREISSGLSIKINGWVSGDGMITVSVSADLSKQGSSDNKDGALPPSTSEKSVTTSVRTKSGKPIVISGLLQNEEDTEQQKVPFLGSIPLAGWLFKSASKTESQTELVIYLTPFVEKEGGQAVHQKSNMRELYEKYVRG